VPALSDDELVKSCLSGNQAHARLLYERYKSYVARVINNRINDPEAVQELLQQTFVKVFNGLQSFKGKSTFKTWLTTIAVNTAKNHISKQIRREKHPRVSLDQGTEEDTPPIEVEDLSGDPQMHLLNKEIMSVIQAGLDMLSDKHKEVILYWSEGFSYEEIASLTQTTVQTVGSRLHYARNQLRKILAPYVRELPIAEEGRNQAGKRRKYGLYLQ
jgi:RNA polymerase sigma-70 factor (ECF subfamily)